MSTPVGPYSPAVRPDPGSSARDSSASSRVADGPVLVPAGSRPSDPGPGQRCVSVVGPARRLADVVKTTVFVTDMADYAAFNAIYTEVLGDHRPARSVVAVAGPAHGGAVEVEVWAYDRPDEASAESGPCAVRASRWSGRSGSPPSAPSG